MFSLAFDLFVLEAGIEPALPKKSDGADMNTQE